MNANVTHAIVLLTPTAFQVSAPVSDAQLVRLVTRCTSPPRERATNCSAG